MTGKTETAGAVSVSYSDVLREVEAFLIDEAQYSDQARNRPKLQSNAAALRALAHHIEVIERFNMDAGDAGEIIARLQRGYVVTDGRAQEL